jgi:hypothetical protein
MVPDPCVSTLYYVTYGRGVMLEASEAMGPQLMDSHCCAALARCGRIKRRWFAQAVVVCVQDLAAQVGMAVTTALDTL